MSNNIDWAKELQAKRKEIWKLEYQLEMARIDVKYLETKAEEQKNKEEK